MRSSTALGLTTLLMVSGSPAVADTLQPTSVTITPAGLETLEATSRTGRFVIGSATAYGRLQVRDVLRAERVKLLPRRARGASISDSGRYVTYSLPVGDWGRSKVMLFDRRKGTTTNVTRRSNGSLLLPTWRNRCTEALCDRDFRLRYSPRLVGGQISGNGRHVVFSANYRKRNKIDVYLKNLRTGKLKVFRGAGRKATALDGGDYAEYLQAPTVSEDARTILIPGLRRTSEDESGEYPVRWGPGRAILDRSRLVVIGGVGNSMTRDGRTITINGTFSGTATSTPPEVAWYDVTTAVSTPADPPGLRMNLNNTSRDGRFVLWKPVLEDTLRIRDRSLATSYDLESAMRAAGYPPSMFAGYNGDVLWGYPNTASLMSGNGRVAFVASVSGAVAVRWSG